MLQRGHKYYEQKITKTGTNRRITFLSLLQGYTIDANRGNIYRGFKIRSHFLVLKFRTQLVPTITMVPVF